MTKMADSDVGVVELEATPLRYGSPNDEAAFFEWLDKVKCVTSYEGKGTILYITVQRSAVDEGELIELISLFTRYGLDRKQLAALDREDFSEWFHGNKAMWFS